MGGGGVGGGVVGGVVGGGVGGGGVGGVGGGGGGWGWGVRTLHLFHVQQSGLSQTPQPTLGASLAT